MGTPVAENSAAPEADPHTADSPRTAHVPTLPSLGAGEFSPISAASDEGPPDSQDVRRAWPLVMAGVAVTIGPSFALMGTAYAAGITRLPPDAAIAAAMVVAVGAIVWADWASHRWWEWSGTRGVDPEDLHRAAVRAGLAWPRWRGRR